MRFFYKNNGLHHQIIVIQLKNKKFLTLDVAAWYNAPSPYHLINRKEYGDDNGKQTQNTNNV